MQTLNAIRFVSKFFTDFVKKGYSTMSLYSLTEKNKRYLNFTFCSRPHSAKIVKKDRFICADLTNDGIKSISKPKIDAYAFFQQIHRQVQPYILNEF